MTAPDRRHPLDAPTAEACAEIRRVLRATAIADPRPQAQIARDAGMAPEALNRLLRVDKPRDGALSSYVRIAAALGMRLTLIPSIEGDG